ncbi:alpha/beta fold hydrolase [Halobacteriaceae archaeon GCM10025711]
MASVPAWVDREAYPFDSRFVNLDAGRVHYVDEGDGRPVVFCHGNPTWSFLYRDLVAGLRDEYRCVALDYLGFGLSEKPPRWTYRPAAHAQVFEAFLDELDLEDVTLVVHDWGGPIGLSYAVRNPEAVRAVVVTNSFMWPVEDDRHFRLFSSLVGGPVGRALIRRRNAFATTVMKLAFADRSRLTPAIHRQYTAPFPTPDSRKGTWVFPREITGSSRWLASLWERRDALAGTPALLVWGLADRAFRVAELRTWEGLFPDAETVAFEDAGHYVAEEKGTEMVPHVERFLAAT